jgi:hypothetical protein
MRRSDSVSKRWSVQAGTGLKRGDSVASNRPTFNPPTPTVPSLGHARTLSREPRSRDATASPHNSRPNSSHLANEQASAALQLSEAGQPDSITQVATAKGRSNSPEEPETLLARSPSKTMDPRRWSPTKASWLESALSKPDSPRFSPTKEEPPPWKLQRSKSQKDLGDGPATPVTYGPVTTDGLMRTPAPGTKTKPDDLHGKLDVNPTSAKMEARATTRTPHSAAPRTEAADFEPKSDLSTKPASAAAKEGPKRQESLRRDDTGTGATDLQTETSRKPPALKPKPQTPPKTDFRATLKGRSQEAVSNNADEPEFKSVFGKLKKAQTQNYKAPDVFKENITRGKNALNVTGGPAPRVRVDEFKESILAKKEAMKAGTSTHKRAESKDASPVKVAEDVPEALRRRNTLHKTKASLEKTDTIPAATPMRTSAKPPEIAAKTPRVTAEMTKLQLEGVREVPSGLGSASTRVASKPARLGQDSASLHNKSFDGEVHNSEASAAVGKTPIQSPAQSDQKPAEAKPQKLPLRPEAANTSPKPSKPVGGIAARLNPALAGLIGRGGSPRPAADGAASIDSIGLPQGSHRQVESSTEPTNLTHITKGRAKGPKRKAPKTETVDLESQTRTQPRSLPNGPALEKTTSAPFDSRSSATKPGFPAKTTTPFKTDDLLAETSTGIKGSLHSPARNSVATPKIPPTPAVKSPGLRQVSSESPVPKKAATAPATASKSPELRRISGQSPAPNEKPSPMPNKSSPKKVFNIAADATSTSRLSPGVQKQSPTENRPLPLTPSRSKLNSPPFPRSTDEASNPKPEGLPKTTNTGFGLSASRAVEVEPRESTPQKEFNLVRDSRAVETRTAQTELSPVRLALGSYFATVPRSDDKAEFDTEAILSLSESAAESIKTTSSQIYEIGSNGKKGPLPPQQEHVLYEECIYFIVHNFEVRTTSKKITECYLWIGDEVPSAAVEDAQIFGRKMAREQSAKLDVIKQGKETSALFSALGGIVITRRSKSSALYMLCGRRHLGHVAFDEVDFSPSSLCSGFPYLISAKFGRFYLWKGQGSGADEVGAARLMGMDLGLTGEMEEVSEGKEPAVFWECFSTPNAKKQFQSSDIWAMRSMDEKRGFPCKLYRLEAERPKSSGGFWGLRATSPAKPANKATLVEISPYTQMDLDPSCVHVLDAWASIYV